MDKETCLAPLGGNFLFNAMLADEATEFAFINISPGDQAETFG